LDFYEVDCSKSCNADLMAKLDLGDKKCLNCEDSIATGNATNLFTVFYPLVGKIYYTELKKI